MAIDFPASPTNGQQFTAAGVTWTWDSVKWAASGASAQIVGGIGDNRIINGDMRIDQRNNGAAGTAQGYTVDRWSFSASQASKFTWGRNYNGYPNAPGFPYNFGFQAGTAYTPLAGDSFQFCQPIEADAIGDLQWGAASAQPVTLSFWAISSLTGTFGATIRNFAATRAYPFTFSLPTASTWTKIAVTIPGDTAGTWVMSGNGGGLTVCFDLGSGATYRAPAGAWAAGTFTGANGTVNVCATTNATFNVTGIKLEIGSVATPFNRQSLAKSMADCQRYYEVGTNNLIWYGYAEIGQSYFQSSQFTVQKRAVPTITPVSAANAMNFAMTPIFNGADVNGLMVSNACTLTGSQNYFQYGWIASAEL
jgi:hypothetical protein